MSLKGTIDLTCNAIHDLAMTRHSYDLLCHEGISRSLLVFQGKAKPPVFKTIMPADGKLQKLTIKPEVRPLSSSVRNMTKKLVTLSIKTCVTNAGFAITPMVYD